MVSTANGSNRELKYNLTSETIHVRGKQIKYKNTQRVEKEKDRGGAR